MEKEKDLQLENDMASSGEREGCSDDEVRTVLNRIFKDYRKLIYETMLLVRVTSNLQQNIQ